MKAPVGWFCAIATLLVAAIPLAVAFVALGGEEFPYQDATAVMLARQEGAVAVAEVWLATQFCASVLLLVVSVLIIRSLTRRTAPHRERYEPGP